MNVKSETCFSNHDGKPLSFFASKSGALDSAKYAKKRYGRSLLPYQCDKCNLWHLSPKSRHTQSEECSYCTDKNGQLKQLYVSKNKAQKRADILFKEKAVLLDVYSCPHQNGFHLTKR